MKLGRKLLTRAFITMALMFIMVIGVSAANGTGIENDPVLITTAQELYDFLTDTDSNNIYGQLQNYIEYDIDTLGYMVVTSVKDLDMNKNTIQIPNESTTE